MPNDNTLLIKINGSAKNFNEEIDKVRRRTQDLEKNLTQMTKVSAIAFTALVASVTLAVVKFGEFEKSFTNVVTLLDKSSFKTKTLEKGISDLKNGVLKLGAESGESFETLNKGLFDLVSAGISAEDSINVLTAATELAIAGATTTENAVKALTASITSYGKEAGSAKDIAEKFFTAQKYGVTTVEQLAQEFNKVGGIAKELGVSFDETLAASTALTANGAKPTTEAFTSMRAVLFSVLRAQKRLSDFGPTVAASLDIQNIKNVGLVKALQQTNVALGGNKVKWTELLQETNAVAAALSLTGNQSELFTTILSEMSDEQGRAATFADALKTKQETLDRSLQRLKQSVNSIVIIFGEAFAPAVTDLANSLSNVAKNIANMDDKTKENIVAVGKMSLLVTGLTTALGLLGLGVLKAISIYEALKVVLLASRLAFVGFWSAATLGIGTLLIFLPEIIGGFKSLFGLFNKESSEEKLEGIVNKTKELKDTRDKLVISAAKATGKRKTQIEQIIAKLDDQIKKNEELEKAQNKVIYSEEISKQKAEVDKLNKSTDELIEKRDKLIIQNETEEKFTDYRAFQNIISQSQLKITEGQIQKNKELTKSIEAEIAAKLKSNDASSKAAGGKPGAGVPSRNIAADEAGMLKESQAFYDHEKKLEAIKKEFEEKSKTDRLANAELEIEDLTTKEELKRETLLAEYEATKEILAEQRAIDLEIDAEIEKEKDKARLGHDKQVRKETLAHLEEQRRVKKKMVEEEHAADRKDKELFLRDQITHGTAIATFNKIMRDQQVNDVLATNSRLAAMSRSKNSTLKEIGKRAAQTEIIVNTARGAIGAYAALSPIPIVGPALGIAAAGALIAFGAEQLVEVENAQRGGIVPQGMGGARDRVPIMAEPGELIVPKALTPDFIQEAGRPGGNETTEAASATVTLQFKDNLMEFIEAQTVERNRLNIAFA